MTTKCPTVPSSPTHAPWRWPKCRGEGKHTQPANTRQTTLKGTTRAQRGGKARGKPTGEGETNTYLPLALPHQTTLTLDPHPQRRPLILSILGTRQRTRKSFAAGTYKVRLSMTNPLTMLLF